jgi:hypothetical protein
MGAPVNQIFNSAAPAFATGPQTPVSIDFYQGAFSARVGVFIPGGSTATYGVEFCMDNVNDSTITPRWFPDATLPAGQTTSGTSSYTSPIQFVRVNIASLSGTLEMKVGHLQKRYFER